MSSLSSTSTPCVAASRFTASNTRSDRRHACSRSGSSTPARCRGRRRRTPIAFTAGSPPLLSRTAAAIRSRDVEPVGREVDVERDQRHVARRRRSRRRSDAARAGPKSGAHSRAGHLRGEPFELAAPDVLELPARPARGRRFVQVHRDAELAPRRRDPTRRASATQSSIVAPRAG